MLRQDRSVYKPPSHDDHPTQKYHSQRFSNRRNILSFSLLIERPPPMDLRLFGLDAPLAAAVHHMLDLPDDHDRLLSHPTRVYVRDQRAMASTPADVKELPNSYVFVVDMPGIKSGDISVQVEDGNVLVVSGKRKREEDKDSKYLAMERRMGKLMRKFALPENADTEKVAAVCRDGVLSVSVEKVPPPEPKKPRTIEVKIA